ncbi:MAG: MraY family glycosyltransferase [Candidatus Methanomethyliaceae archaeon]
MKYLLPGAGVSLFSAFLATWVSIILARRWGVLDHPGQLKIHRISVPRLGGLGIVCGTVTGSVVSAFYGLEDWNYWFAPTLGAVGASLVGFADDLRGLRPSWKLCGQLVAGLVFLLVSPDGRALLDTLTQVPPALWLELLIVVAIVLLFLAMTSNAVNLLDGMDAMAGGLGAIMGVFLALSGHLAAAPSVFTVGLCLAAACMGFLLFNRPPARTFMGDCGSLFIGFLLAALAFEVVLHGKFRGYNLLGVLLVLSVPLTDTGFAVLRRLLRRGDVFSGDRFHLYDCLHARLGFSIGRTLAVMYLLAAAGGALGTCVLAFGSALMLLAGALFFAVLCFLAICVGCLGRPVFPRWSIKTEEVIRR